MRQKNINSTKDNTTYNLSYRVPKASLWETRVSTTRIVKWIPSFDGMTKRTGMTMWIILLALLVGLTSINSHSQNSWQQTNGPEGGSIRAFAVSGTNLFAGTHYNGVFLSTNNGTSWTAVNSGLTSADVYALAVSGTNIFAGTYEGGVFRSTNNGTSWTAMNSGLTNTNVNAFAVSGTNLFAGTDGGVFLSTINGTSWTARNSGLTSTYINALAVNGTNLFAGTGTGGVFHSTNNGTSWTAVNSGLTNTSVYALAVSGTNLFAGTLYGGVFLSTNNGTSWTAVNSGLTAKYVKALAVIGTNLFAGTNFGGVFLSTNNGTSWTAMNSGLTETSINAFAISGTNLFAGTLGGGVWRRSLSDIVGVQELVNVSPREYSLEQNYPNPFNPTTTIRFTIPVGAIHESPLQTTLKIYNVLGQEIATLINNESLDAGENEIEFNASELSSGIYFYRLISDKFSQTHKMILLK